MAFSLIERDQMEATSPFTFISTRHIIIIIIIIAIKIKIKTKTNHSYLRMCRIF